MGGFFMERIKQAMTEEEARAYLSMHRGHPVPAESFKTPSIARAVEGEVQMGEIKAVLKADNTVLLQKEKESLKWDELSRRWIPKDKKFGTTDNLKF
jgi:hypothetical protein